MIPLGQSESHKLEFKARDALRSLTPIGRAVVAMLNAEGGEIWIGLREEAGRAVAIEDIPNAALEMGRLWDHCLDAIEPRPRPTEVKIETREQGGQTVMRVSVKRGKRRPYAYQRDGGHYLVRAGARTRTMTREELRDLFTKGEREEAGALERLLDVRKAVQGSTQASFLIQLMPEQQLDLDLSSARLRQLLSDPEASGNRASGWTVMNRFAKLGTRSGILSSSNEESATEIHRDGSITYKASLERLWHGEAPHQIYPHALCELTVSLLRLGAVLYKESQLADGQVLADLAFLAAGGWFLRAYSPSAHGYLMESHRRENTLPEEDFFLDRPLKFDVEKELIPEPDWCAFRLIQRTYEAFGFAEEDMIPGEFDRASRRFVLGRSGG